MRRASLLTVLLCACIAYAVAVTRLARTQQRLQSSASTKEVTALFNACAAKCETNSCVQQCANGANAASTPRPVVAEPASPPPVSSAPSITAPPISPAPASAAGSTAAGDDDKDGITIVSNVNTLNDIPPPGAANGNGNPSADGSTNGGNNNGGNNQQPPGPPSQSRTVQKCPAFWQSNGCVRPKIPNAAAENGDCDGTVDNCVEKCCQNPIIYGNCQNYLTQKGCPANWEGKPSVEGVACGEDTVCQGRCCKPRPYTCAHFWDAKSCDPLTHTKFGGRDAFQCDPTSTHCVKVCCQPKTIQCPTYFQVYKQCPPVFRPNANDVACLPGFEWSRGDACFKRCCDAINHNDGRCSMWGDPHMITWDNVRFDCHTNGEYLLYSNDQMNEAVHNAQVKNPNPSLQHVPPFNIGMAFRAGTDVFSLELVPPSWATFQVNVRYNKKMVPYPDDEIQYGPFIVYPVGTLPTPNAGPADFSQAVGLNILNTRTGTGVAFWFFQTDYHQRGGNIDITIPDRGQKGRMVTKGLCGSWNGNAADDLTGAQGQRCDGGNSNVCCLSWTVPRDQSLFPHPPAEGGGHQEGIGTVCNSSAKLAQAKQFCNTAIGLHQDCVLEFCAGDGNKNLKSEIEQVFNGK